MHASDPQQPDLAAFLAADFARLEAHWGGRLAALDGQRLYLAGATGFFGRSLLALLVFLRTRGIRCEVTAVSRDPGRFQTAHAWCRDLHWLRWWRADIADAWPQDGHHDLLLHAATDTHADAHRNPGLVFDGIVVAARNALECAHLAGVRRMLLCGSGAQYGALGAYPHGIPEHCLAACDPNLPASAYGEGKRVAELLAAIAARTADLAVIPTRGFAFVGPGLPLDGHFAIGNFIGAALAGRDIALRSDGAALRSYLYSADLAVWLLCLLLGGRSGEAVNVGSDQSLSVLDLAVCVRDLLAPQAAVRAGEARPDEPRQVYVPDITRARNLGLAVWTPLEQAIMRTALWYRP